MIHFNVPPYSGNEINYIQQAIANHKICGDGEFTKKCSAFLEKIYPGSKVLLTTSGTSALEMAAILCGINPGDEVIMPSYTFCSTADAFVQRGAKIVFVDIRPDTMNIDEEKIERAITSKTKAIVPVHYAGVACQMNKIMDIAKKYNLKVVEDAAQGIFSEFSWGGVYDKKPLGTIGDFGCLSFHETKNLSMGEGGAIIINNPSRDFEAAEILREKGTNRSKFFRGQIDKYTWVNYGSSYLPSDINAAYLYAQLESAEKIQNSRMHIWNRYFNELKDTAKNHAKASAKWIVIMDDDLQHSPHDIPALYKKAEEGFDCVYADFPPKKQAAWKNFGSWFNGKCAEFLIAKPKGLYLSPFKIIKGDVIAEVIKSQSLFPYIDGLIFQVTQNITQIPIQHHKRAAGKSNYNLIKSIRVFAKLVFGFSVTPLRIASWIGTLCALAGFGLGIFYLVEYFTGKADVTGWTTLVVLILFIGGLNLISLGIIGEYIGRSYLTVNKNPRFTISEIKTNRTNHND